MTPVEQLGCQFGVFDIPCIGQVVTLDVKSCRFRRIGPLSCTADHQCKSCVGFTIPLPIHNIHVGVFIRVLIPCMMATNDFQHFWAGAQYRWLNKSKIGFMVPGTVPGCFVEVAIVALVTLALHVIHASGRNQALAQHFEAEK